MALAYIDDSPESLRLMNEVLPEVAKAVYLGMVVSYTHVDSMFGSSRKQ